MSLTSPQTRAGLRNAGPDVVVGQIVAPAVQAYTLALSLPFAARITGITAILSAGTVTATVQNNGNTVNGLSGIAMSVVEAEQAADYDSSAVVNAGDPIKLNITAAAGAANLAFSLTYQRLN